MAMSVALTNFNGQLVYENRGGVERFYAPDTLGSTAALLDPTSAVTDKFTYWPYGEIQNHVGSSSTTFTFLGTLGYYLDVLANFIYVRARHLRQGLTKWQTLDPFWPRQSPYTYCNCQPISVTDATGLAVGIDNIIIGIASCVIAAGVSCLFSWINGDSTATAVCKAGITCLISGVTAALIAEFPVLARCLGNAVVSAATILTQGICDGHDTPWQCTLGVAIINAALACAIIGVTVLENLILKILNSVFGGAMKSLCKSNFRYKILGAF